MSSRDSNDAEQSTQSEGAKELSNAIETQPEGVPAVPPKNAKCGESVMIVEVPDASFGLEMLRRTGRSSMVGSQASTVHLTIMDEEVLSLSDSPSPLRA